MSITLRAINSTYLFYRDYLTKYKTASAKRSCMTRDIKSHKELITEIEQALERTDSSKGYYLGDKYYPHHLAHYKKELAALESIRAAIK